MANQRIYASTGNHTLLQDGKVKLIGFTKTVQHYVNGGCIIPFVVILHYGTKYQDRFYFENDTLVYNSVQPTRDWYIHELYAELAKRVKITPIQFIKEVVSAYTLNEMGF